MMAFWTSSFPLSNQLPFVHLYVPHTVQNTVQVISFNRHKSAMQRDGFSF